MDAIQIVTEPRRQEILRLVWDEDRLAGDIAEHFDLTFGAVSHHLGILRDAGYVTVRKSGTRRIYRADQAALGPLVAVLESMWAVNLDSLPCEVEHGRTTKRRA
jgi:DNA-binding transcriptional ArsR family regulator